MSSGQLMTVANLCRVAVPVNAHAEVKILNLNYIYSFIFYSSTTKLSNDIHPL